MSIDLQHTLADLAGSVHDDALTARLTAQVGPMVGRIRRRRAARAAAVGTVSMGTVAAMAVGAVALANRGEDRPTPGPATQAPQPPSPVPHDGEALECGDAVPEALVSDDALALAGDVPPATEHGSDLLTALRWWAPGDEAVTYAQARVDVAVARDGVVVAVASADPPTEPGDDVTLGSTETGARGSFASELPLTPCGGDAPLEDDDYQVVATVTLTSGDGATWRASAGPWPMTVEPPFVVDDASISDAEAQAGVQDIIDASPQVGPEHPFGTCGTTVPPIGQDEPLSLELDLDSGTGSVYSAGQAIDGVTILLPTGARTSVVADLPDTGPAIVLVRDGVVVARSAPSEDALMRLETTPSAQVLYANGSAELCSLPGADAPEMALATGIYQAYAVMSVALREITEEDGTTRSVSDTFVLRSQPVDVIVQGPRG